MLFSCVPVPAMEGLSASIDPLLNSVMIFDWARPSRRGLLTLQRRSVPEVYTRMANVCCLSICHASKIKWCHDYSQRLTSRMRWRNVSCFSGDDFQRLRWKDVQVDKKYGNKTILLMSVIATAVHARIALDWSHCGKERTEPMKAVCADKLLWQGVPSYGASLERRTIVTDKNKVYLVKSAAPKTRSLPSGLRIEFRWRKILLSSTRIWFWFGRYLTG